MTYPQLMRQRIALYLSEGRPVSGGKGDDTDKSAENSSADFATNLQSAFAQNFGNQSSILSFLSNTMKNGVESPQGFTAPQAAALSTQNIEGAAQATKAAQQATNAQIAAKGGNGLPSGVNAQITAGINAAGATQEAQGANQIAQANAQLQQSNYWKSVDGLEGVASAENPDALANSSNSAEGDVAGLSNAFTQSNQSQLLGALGGLAGGAGTAAAGYFKNN
jgi:hypothetical protein